MTDVILGAFFCSKPDPQRPAETSPSRHKLSDYVKLWKVTANSLGIPVILFTDVESAHHQPGLAHSNLCRVIRWSPGKFSVNDERFLAFEAYLASSTSTRVCLTDSGDVVFKKTPL